MSRVLAAVLPLLALLTSCALFLRAGRIEESAAGRVLILPAQNGQHEAAGWTKTLTPRFILAPTGESVTIELTLTKHVAESRIPEFCDRVVVSTSDTNGVASPLQTDLAAGGEVWRGVYSKQDLQPFAVDEEAVRIDLCEISYVFNGRNLATLFR